jgi:hypothetical protein
MGLFLSTASFAAVPQQSSSAIQAFLAAPVLYAASTSIIWRR